MSKLLNVLVVGRSSSAVNELRALVDGGKARIVDSRVVVNGHVDPLHDIERMPDALVLRVSENWSGELDALCERPAITRPPLLVIGPAGDADVMRMAMHAGARDYLTEPVAKTDLESALLRIEQDHNSNNTLIPGSITSFINAKGGSGATLIACTVAHIMASAQNLKVALVDLDIQFGALTHYFDLEAGHGLLDALENIRELDATALDGFMTKHRSGLRILSATPDTMVLPGEIAINQLETLLDLMTESYQHLVFDLPRQIDHITSTVIDRSDRIYVVVQQNLSHVRDATRLLGVLHDELGVTDDQISVIVNRYDKNAPISLGDIEKALRRDHLITVPNDFRSVTSSINAGAPLYSQHRSAAVTRALMKLESDITGRTITPGGGLFARALSGLRGA